MRLIRKTSLLGILMIAGLGVSCSPQKVPSSAVVVARPSVAGTQPSNLSGLHNMVAFSDRLVSGSVPENDAAFAQLRAMGFRSIISVDGARPDVETAAKYGLRYVHLPIGYNGMDQERALQLARAVRDLDGPVYLHCHHGKHRSAAAAAAISVTLGDLTREQALQKMTIAGTSASYPGLFQCAKDATCNPAAVEATAPLLPSVWKTTGLVDAMVAIDETIERLKLVEKVPWATPKDHPDLVPTAEAGRLADLLRNLHDDADVKHKPTEFAVLLADSSAKAASLEAGLAQNIAHDQLSARFKLLGQSCNSCHTKFRNERVAK